MADKTSGEPGSQLTQDDKQAILHALSDRIESLAEALLGAPAMRARQEWRWGRKGSLRVQISGTRAGQWQSFEASTGGGPIALIAWVLGSGHADAWRWAQNWLGGTAGAPVPDRARERAARERDAEEAQSERKKQRFAQELATAGVAARDAASACRYLRDRGIDPATLPDSWRYTEAANHIKPPAHGALVVPGHTPDGEIQFVQRVYLHRGRKCPIPHAPLNGQAKQSVGRQKGAHTALPGPADAPLVLAEGPETGLSIWQAIGCETWIAVGGIAKLVELVDDGRDVIVARDHDAPGTPADRALERAVAALADGSRRVWVATPPRQNEDWNDVLVADGAETVRASFAAAELRHAGPPEPRYSSEGVSLEHARRETRRHVEQFFQDAADFHAGDRPHAPQALVGITTGGGKSSILRAVAARRIAYHQLYTDYQGDAHHHERMQRGVIAVPTHRLAREYVAALQRMDIPAMVWRGREQDDEHGEPACLNLDAVRDALAAYADIESSVCRARDAEGNEIRCPLYDQCAYQRQKREAELADVVVITHASLFHGRPAAIGDRGWLIIDESFTDQALRGTEGDKLLALDALGRPAEDSLEIEDEVRERLTLARRTAARALADAGNGPVAVEQLTEAGLTAAQIRQAARDEWRYKVEPGITPDQDAETRSTCAQRAAAVNGEIARRARAWRLLAEAMDAGRSHAGGVRLRDIVTEAGSVRGIELLWSSDIAEGWPEAVLCLDATPRPELAQRFLPRLEVRARLDVTAPNVRVRQVPDAPTTRHKTNIAPDRRERDRVTAARHLRDLYAYIQREARGHTGTVLVVCQEHMRESFERFAWRPNVELVHYNAVRGLDRWREASAVIIVGRPLPGPASIERLAAAYTNTVPEAVPAHTWWYDSVTTGIQRRDGRPTAATMPIHPDSFCEDVRRAVTEDEMIQAIGRGRGINRTADNPLYVHILSEIVLPITVDEVVNWEQVRPRSKDLQLARGVAVHTAAHAAALHPDIWASPDAVRQAARRERAEAEEAPARSVTPAFWDSIKADVTEVSSTQEPGTERGDDGQDVVTGSYRVDARGTREAGFIVDAAMTADPAAVLEDALGTLAECDYDTDLVLRRYQDARRQPDTAATPATTTAETVGVEGALQPGDATAPDMTGHGLPGAAVPQTEGHAAMVPWPDAAERSPFDPAPAVDV